jgi:hypothetical protein
MRRYGMLGTPTLILIDHVGKLLLHEFGRLDDLRLGMMLVQLLAEPINPVGFLGRIQIIDQPTNFLRMNTHRGRQLLLSSNLLAGAA